MVFVKAKQVDSHRWIRILIQATGESMKNTILNNNVKGLEGIQSMAAFMGLWTALNNGPGVLAYLIQETIPLYDPKRPLPLFQMRRILDEYSGFDSYKLKQLIIGLQEDGWIQVVYDKNINPDFQNLDSPDFAFIRLDPTLWTNYLKSFIRKKSETYAYVESIGRIAWASILAKEGEPCGVRSFVVLASILADANANNNSLLIKEIKLKCAHMGVARFNQLLARDNEKVAKIRFIEEVDGDKVRVNKNALYVYNSLVLPIANTLLQKQQIP